MSKRYEVQVYHKVYGWIHAGNYPAWDKRQGLKSLAKLERPFGSSKTYRLVELIPREIKRVRSKKDTRYM